MVWITECHISRYMIDRVMILVSEYSLKFVLSDKTITQFMKNSTCSWFCWSGSHIYSSHVFNSFKKPMCLWMKWVENLFPLKQKNGFSIIKRINAHISKFQYTSFYTTQTISYKTSLKSFRFSKLSRNTDIHTPCTLDLGHKWGVFVTLQRTQEWLVCAELSWPGQSAA